MKKITILSLLLTIILATYAQEKAFVNVYQSNKAVVSMLRSEVDSITYSLLDDKVNRYDKMQSQVIHTKDSIYTWPVNMVDSTTFVWIDSNDNNFIHPIVYTQHATDVEYESATLNGWIMGLTSSAIQDGIGFLVSQSHDEITHGEGQFIKAHVTNDRSRFSLDLTGLIPDERYYYKALLNFNGQIYEGLTRYFNTPAVHPNGHVGEIGCFHAVTHGKKELVGKLTEAEMGFFINNKHELNSDCLKYASKVMYNISGKVEWESLIPELTPERRYYVWSYVTTSGKTFAKYIGEFETSTLPLQTIETETEDITATTATFAGNITTDDILYSKGNVGISLDVRYGYSEGYVTKFDCGKLSNTKDGLFTVSVGGLPPNSRVYYSSYYYEDEDNVFDGNKRYLDTKNIALKTFAEYDGISTSTFKGIIEIVNDEFSSYNEVGFYYDTEPIRTVGKMKVVSSRIYDTFTSVVTDLPQNTTIYVRAYAKVNGMHILSGDQVEFQTTQLPDEDDKEYVDLGLPSGTLWATHNIGANSQEEYGYYYAWGETEPKENYDWTTYKYCISWNNMTKYCTESANGSVDNKTELEPEDDAATVNWGSDWEMPNAEQMKELLNYCTVTYVYRNSVAGRLFTSNLNGNSIFFPAAGYISGNWLESGGFSGHYWTSSVCTDYVVNHFGSNRGIEYTFDSGITSSLRCVGSTIRPVRTQKAGGKVRMIELSHTTLILNIEDSQRLIANVYPYGADNTMVTWESDNESIAKVSNIGVITAIGKGTCIVTCRATDGSGVYAECKIKVYKGDNYEWVDLGLPSGTLWATCNVGANKPEEYGDYFAWGETISKEEYSWSTYKHCNGSGFDLTKYCTDSYSGIEDGKTELEPGDDAATVKWGNEWKIPNKEQLSELLDSDYTTVEFTQQNGVYGILITGKSNNMSIFLPAAGNKSYSSTTGIGSDGQYWSSSLNGWDSGQSSGIGFSLYNIFTNSGTRYIGRTIRPVRAQ